MIPDAPFILSLAGLNASLAGLGGLLIGLRRASGLDSLEALRLRQVVEFAFANLLLAIALQPLARLLGDPAEAVRASSAVTLAYVVVALVVLDRRVVRVGIAWGRAWAATALGLTVIGVVISAAAVVMPTAGAYELLLVVMLARPIAVFLLVLATLDETTRETTTPRQDPPTLTKPPAASPAAVPGEPGGIDGKITARFNTRWPETPCRRVPLADGVRGQRAGLPPPGQS